LQSYKITQLRYLHKTLTAVAAITLVSSMEPTLTTALFPSRWEWQKKEHIHIFFIYRACERYFPAMRKGIRTGVNIKDIDKRWFSQRPAMYYCNE